MPTLGRLMTSSSVESLKAPNSLIIRPLQLTHLVFNNRQLRQNPMHFGAGRDISSPEKIFPAQKNLGQKIRPYCLRIIIFPAQKYFA